MNHIAPTTSTTTRRPLSRAAIAAALALIHLYQHTLAHFLGGRCRFYPSCSCYAAEALTTHGPIRGLWLTFRRLSRCHPLGGHGVDLVPPARVPNNSR
ncbi:MAG: membrane protein insertion efficiency factor YidD [Phycisphaerales bacterium]